MKKRNLTLETIITYVKKKVPKKFQFPSKTHLRYYPEMKEFVMIEVRCPIPTPKSYLPTMM